jgi:hypothetical protein
MAERKPLRAAVASRFAFRARGGQYELVSRFVLTVVVLAGAMGILSWLTGGSNLSLSESAIFLALYGLALSLVSLPLLAGASFALRRTDRPRQRQGGVVTATLAVVLFAAALMAWARFDLSAGAFVFLACFGFSAYFSIREASPNRPDAARLI